MVQFFPSVWRDVGDDAIKVPYRRIFGVEYDFCGVVAITSKTIENNLNFFRYNCKIISAKISTDENLHPYRNA